MLPWAHRVCPAESSKMIKPPLLLLEYLLLTQEFSCRLWAKTFCQSLSVLSWIKRARDLSKQLKIATWQGAGSSATGIWVIFKATFKCEALWLVLCLMGVPKFPSHWNLEKNSGSVFPQRGEAATSFTNLAFVHTAKLGSLTIGAWQYLIPDKNHCQITFIRTQLHEMGYDVEDHKQLQQRPPGAQSLGQANEYIGKAKFKNGRPNLNGPSNCFAIVHSSYSPSPIHLSIPPKHTPTLVTKVEAKPGRTVHRYWDAQGWEGLWCLWNPIHGTFEFPLPWLHQVITWHMA